MLAPHPIPTRHLGLRVLATAACVFLTVIFAFADGPGLIISEFSAASDGSFPDEDGDASDWIEIRNASADVVALGGFSLTDSADDLTRWSFPQMDLQSGALVVVFASGKNRAVAGGELHTNFSLSAGGEYLALIAPDGASVACEFAPQFPRQILGVSFGSASAGDTVAEIFVSTPAVATWLVPTSDIGTSWRDIGFDDSTWGVAQTGIGYGPGYENFIGSGGNIQSAMQGITDGAYIRVPFEVDDPLGVQSLDLSIHFEDGFVAYLNGHELASANAPAAIAYDSAATRGIEVGENDPPEIFPLDFAGKLVGGDNILAIHLMNQTRGSSDVLAVPELHAAVSTGDELVRGYFTTSTPGAPNTPVNFTGFVADTLFDIDRGFFDTPFDLNISCPTPGATIVYTTDGNSPTLSYGTAVPAADENTPPVAILNIAGTTVVRAAAFRDGFRETNIDTQTYLFLENVLDQSDTPPPGYPLPWITRNGSAIGGDYGMDPDIVGPVYAREELKGALTSLPTISIVTDIANLFDQQTGIQVNPQDAGLASERPVSVEMIGFPDGPNIQNDAGMRMNGNASRSPTRPKHNFRIIYRNEYGTGRLRYPLFGGDAPVDRFNQFVLRGGNGNSWIHPSASVYNSAMYIRDQWFRDAHTAMGYPEALQSEVHVYFNGLYWGMHHLFERIEEEWAAERFGGAEDDWEGFRIVGGNRIEIIKGTPAEELAGILDSWQAAIAAANAQDLVAFEQFIDLDAFIDYLLLNFHAGNNDWDGNNVRAMRRTNPPGKFMWFCHDAERAGFNVPGNISLNVTNKNTSRAPTGMNTALRGHPEYAIRFADRAYKHLFNGGGLTPENGIAQWSARADGIREAMKAESARWGDFRGDPPRTLVQWEAALLHEYDDWFPFRTPVTISQLRSTGLYPAIDPPVFNQHGGMVTAGFALIIESELGEVYYTTDGSDPRLPGGGVNPTASLLSGSGVPFDSFDFGADWKYDDSGTDLGTVWRLNNFDDSAWQTGTAALGYGSVDDTTITTTVNPARHITTYFRREIEITDADLITGGRLEITVDGGAVVYLNGTEIARDGMPAGGVGFSTLASSEGNEGAITSYSFDAPAFVEGTNVVAIEVHQGTSGSSDMAIDLALGGTRLSDSSSSVAINQTTTVRTRALNDGNEWSAVNEATFRTGTAAGKGNLVVSEVHYNPDASDGELSEFIELMNISDTTLDLGGVAFTQGIDFTFADSITLAAGGRIVVVADNAAFESAHGAGVGIAGIYAGRLANSGERITLLAGGGAIIQSFLYDDQAPWPTEADGDGFSLVLVAPRSDPDHGLPQNWRASVAPGGNPGTSDAIAFTGDPATELLDYALGDPGAVAIEVIDGSPVFQFPRVIGADDVEYSVELSGDLESWRTGQAVFLGQLPRAGGTVMSQWQLADLGEGREYARLVVALRE